MIDKVFGAQNEKKKNPIFLIDYYTLSFHQNKISLVYNICTKDVYYSRFSLFWGMNDRKSESILKLLAFINYTCWRTRGIWS